MACTAQTTTRRPTGCPGAVADHPARPRGRRRLIDPTTCERDYTREELEFMQALERYKRASGRPFPTCSELLEVVRSLGYHRVVTA